VANFKYLEVIFKEENNKKIDLQERIKNDNKAFYAIEIFLK
jgi:hypothetical protein